MCSTIFFVRRSPWSGGRAARCPPSPHFAADSSAAVAAVANLFGSDRRSSPASGVDHKKGCGERERERKRPLDTETRLAHGREKKKKKKKKKEQNNNGTNRLDFSPLLSRNYGGADGRTDAQTGTARHGWGPQVGGRISGSARRNWQLAVPVPVSPRAAPADAAKAKREVGFPPLALDLGVNFHGCMGRKSMNKRLQTIQCHQSVSINTTYRIKV